MGDGESFLQQGLVWLRWRRGAGLRGHRQTMLSTRQRPQPIFRQLRNLHYAWHLCCGSELIVLPRDSFGLVIALAGVSSLLRRARGEKVG